MRPVRLNRFAWCCAAYCVLALSDSEGVQPPRPKGPTVEQLKEAAGNGDPGAQTELALRYWNGTGVNTDRKEAVRLMQAAVEKGHPPAQYTMGMWYRDGLGVKRDAKKAAELVAGAAEKDHLPAVRELAKIYASGLGLPADPAKAAALVDGLLGKSAAVVKDREAAVGEKAVFFDAVVAAYAKLNKGDRKPGYEKVLKVLNKEAPKSSLLRTVEGQFYAGYAWDARGSGFANTLTKEQADLFRERLKLAAVALEDGWHLDNTNTRAAARRINVAMGLGEDRETVDRWFRRATKADRTDLGAYRAKLTYLEPKWSGSAQDVLDFGRECLHTGLWQARVPFVLVEAHEALSKYPRPGRAGYSTRVDPVYFADPGVWDDVRSVYQPYLRRYPHSHRDRSKFARLACWAKDWAEAHKQFTALGDDVDRSVFAGDAELNRMKKEAAEKAK